jgi:putative hydrolases of HD superfamily
MKDEILNTREAEIVQTIFRFNILTRLPRTGFLMRGVDDPESVGEHIFLASLLATLLLPELRRDGYDVDGEKLISMVLLHEAGEILLGDIPAPAAIFFGKAGKSQAELDAGQAVLRNTPEAAEIAREFEEGKTLEARIARGLDKLQMMIRVLIYVSEGKGNLEEFWGFDGNFPKTGVSTIDGFFLKIEPLRGKIGLDYQGMMRAE